MAAMSLNTGLLHSQLKNLTFYAVTAKIWERWHWIRAGAADEFVSAVVEIARGIRDRDIRAKCSKDYRRFRVGRKVIGQLLSTNDIKEQRRLIMTNTMQVRRLILTYLEQQKPTI